MKRLNSCTILFRELHPYVFTDGYKVPKHPSGKYQLTFTTSKGMSTYQRPVHVANPNRREKLYGHLPLDRVT